MAESFPIPASDTIRSAILSASPVVRLGLACPSEAARERAADDLTEVIVKQLRLAHDQLTLAL